MFFEEQKESFFWLVDYLLKIGVIKFIVPGADCYVSLNHPSPRLTIEDNEAHWNASSKEIIDELRKAWPEMH